MTNAFKSCNNFLVNLQEIVHESVLHPKLVMSLKEKREQAVHISSTNSVHWDDHTLAEQEIEGNWEQRCLLSKLRG